MSWWDEFRISTVYCSNCETDLGTPTPIGICKDTVQPINKDFRIFECHRCGYQALFAVELKRKKTKK